MGLVQESLPFVAELTDSEPTEDDRTPNPSGAIERIAQKYKLKVDGDAAARLAADLESGIEKAADLCRVDPPVCRDNLGIGREQMPQIDEKTLPFFLDAWRKTGTRVVEDVVPVGKLKATQMEINAGKVAGMALAAKDGKFPTIQAPVIVSSDSFVLDGHHRWAALMVLSPKNSMAVYRVEVPIQSLLQAARQFEGTTFAGLRTQNPRSARIKGLSVTELSTLLAALEAWEKLDEDERVAYFADPPDAPTEKELRTLKGRLSGAEEDARLTPPAGEYDALVERIRQQNPSALGELHTALRLFDEGKAERAEAPVRRAAEQLETKSERGDWSQKYGGYDDTSMRVKNPYHRTPPYPALGLVPLYPEPERAATALQAVGLDAKILGPHNEEYLRVNDPNRPERTVWLAWGSDDSGWWAARVDKGDTPTPESEWWEVWMVGDVQALFEPDVSPREGDLSSMRRVNPGKVRRGNPSQQQLDPAATEPDLDDDSDLWDPEPEPIDYGEGDGDVPEEWVGDMPEDARMHAQLEVPAAEPLAPYERAIRDSSTWENSNSAERNVIRPTVAVTPPTAAEQAQQLREVGITAAYGAALAARGDGREGNPGGTGAVVEHLHKALEHLHSTPNLHETRRGGFDPVGSAQQEIHRAITLLKGRHGNPHPPAPSVKGAQGKEIKGGRNANPLEDVGFREPQSLHFPKDRFTRGKALDWCEKNGCVPIKGEQTEGQWRLRLAPPEDFRQGQFRTFTTHDGVQVILGELKRPRNPVGIVPLANLISAAAGVGGAIKSVAAPAEKGE